MNLDIIKACDLALVKLNKSRKKIYLTDKFTQDYVYHGDREVLKTHGYHGVYNTHINKLASIPQICVELGSCLGSALVYKSLFETRQISLDIRNKDEEKYGIEFLHFDEKSFNSFNRVAEMVEYIDFFVDDAIHDRESQLFTLTNIHKIMRKGGLYIIEESKIKESDIEDVVDFHSYITYDMRNETNYCNSIITFIHF